MFFLATGFLKTVFVYLEALPVFLVVLRLLLFWKEEREKKVSEKKKKSAFSVPEIGGRSSEPKNKFRKKILRKVFSLKLKIETR